MAKEITTTKIAIFRKDELFLKDIHFVDSLDKLQIELNRLL